VVAAPDNSDNTGRGGDHAPVQKVEFQGCKNSSFLQCIKRKAQYVLFFQLAKKQPLYIGGIFPISGVKYVAPELAPGTAVQ
jgi:hypothetical protein